MRTEDVRAVSEYLALIEEIGANDLSEEERLHVRREGELLFRGQSHNYPLLPKIARNGDGERVDAQESRMLVELRRLGTVYQNLSRLDAWDLLTVAQHNGMATRLLDWTRNPLMALWFAVRNGIGNEGVFVYVLLPHWNIDLLDRAAAPIPSRHTGLSLLRPNLEHARIIAQDAWFTVHSRSRKHRTFMPLGENDGHAETIIRIRVQGNSRELLENLDTLGVSYQTAFPDLEGVCRYINWKLGEKKATAKCDRYGNYAMRQISDPVSE